MDFFWGGGNTDAGGGGGEGSAATPAAAIYGFGEARYCVRALTFLSTASSRVFTCSRGGVNVLYQDYEIVCGQEEGTGKERGVCLCVRALLCFLCPSPSQAVFVYDMRVPRHFLVTFLSSLTAVCGARAHGDRLFFHAYFIRVWFPAIL